MVRLMNVRPDPLRTGSWQEETTVSTPRDLEVEAVPREIGRYRIVRVLGLGGFGTVYLAQDDQLQRRVAIKVPHRELISRVEHAEAYLAEARTVARLDHPHIVPVFDIGSTENYPFFLVSKYVDGCTLAQKIRNERLSIRETIDLVACVAEALHYAHRMGFVHRDIKPGNILLDAQGKPYIADFGLALKDTNVGKGPKQVGTPHYMSPEQARGEGHRVDGRSDVFSLGVVAYELLTGKRPFHADSRSELMEQITSFEARPLRQINEAIPRELERICFKALSKRVADRYMTAQDFADDLRHVGAQQGPSEHFDSARDFRTSWTQSARGEATPVASPRSGANTVASAISAHASQVVSVVPKGLRAFDAGDADFFLELLPGPRDREGLPDSLRFWKTRIEDTDADSSFAIGLIYGPSGCGKTSLVKAGLLPRISGQVVAVYVDAGNDTEARVLRGLQRRCPGLSSHLSLKDSLSALRRGDGVDSESKVLIILDQFEQWLHQWRQKEGAELVQALRQCDGSRVQCLIMVRDDFWMAATRLMRELEVDLVPGRNLAAVDLFELRHARKVLTAFGRAFGTLPGFPADLSAEQSAFVEQAVCGLAPEGKIICVRLALFAEMMKDKPWTLAALKAVGGAEGVGVAFLEDSFAAPTASPAHRLHQKAARAVLQTLLPDAGTDLKGHRRSSTTLLEASGYATRPKDFDDLIRLLESELRLITPSEDEAEDGGAEATDAVDKPPEAPTSRYYQLTHDYLVRPLREWLNRKQKETRRGRAELALADHAGVWNARPENRQLPSFLQWLNIRLWTRKAAWSDSERKVMGRAARYHGLRVLILFLVLGIAALAEMGLRSRIQEQQRRDQAAGLVQRLLDANIAQVPSIIDEMEPYRAWANPLLQDASDKAAANSHRKLHTSLALLAVDESHSIRLFDQLLAGCEPAAVAVIRDALFSDRTRYSDRLWKTLEEAKSASGGSKLRAGSLLAHYEAANPRWDKCTHALVEELVSENPIFLGVWIENLRPIQDRLVTPLVGIFRERRPERSAERMMATRILAVYAASEPELLGDLLLDADEKQWHVLYPILLAHKERGIELLQAEIAKRIPADAPEKVKEALSRRQANAGVALLRMDRPENVWPLFQWSPDPRLRTYLIHRARPLGVRPEVIAQRLHEESDVSMRRALTLALGHYALDEIAYDQRGTLTRKLREMYLAESDPGLHAAAEWTLRRWNQEKWLQATQDKLSKNLWQREWRLSLIRAALNGKPIKNPPGWYVNGQGQTLVVIPGPAEFMIGSPPTEVGREPGETLHAQRIAGPFAIADKPVTVEQFLRFRKDYDYQPQYAPSKDCPVHMTSWYLAAAYCNWLSQQEGIPEEEWCYLPNAEGKYAEGMKLAPNYLQRGGYRLPTEAEWEYACRAHTVTSRYFGESEELINEYGWSLLNSASKQWPVGLKLPNDWGLFDMYGNVFNWCQDRFAEYADSKALADGEADPVVYDKDNRVMRGSSYNVTGQYLRSAQRFKHTPALRSLVVGIRPVKSFKSTR
jgi:serine/threonine protein kinase/formylglycine-generating enzyme required for sulfatase activity